MSVVCDNGSFSSPKECDKVASKPRFNRTIVRLKLKVACSMGLTRAPRGAIKTTYSSPVLGEVSEGRRGLAGKLFYMMPRIAKYESLKVKIENCE